MTKVIYYDKASNSVVDTSKHFTFQTVAEMNSAIQNGLIPIGSIIFVDENESMQNVQIVDLASYAKKNDVNGALGGKVDKTAIHVMSNSEIEDILGS